MEAEALVKVLLGDDEIQVETIGKLRESEAFKMSGGAAVAAAVPSKSEEDVSTNDDDNEEDKGDDDEEDDKEIEELRESVIKLKIWKMNFNF